MSYPSAARLTNVRWNARPDRVDSNAKSRRAVVRSLSCRSIRRPASIAADRGSPGESRAAMTSALTNVSIPTSRKSSSAADDLPAPLGPAMTTTRGRRASLNAPPQPGRPHSPSQTSRSAAGRHSRARRSCRRAVFPTRSRASRAAARRGSARSRKSARDRA